MDPITEVETEATLQEGRWADPAGLGLAAFAVTTFLISLYLLGGATPPQAYFLFAVILGGIAQFVAGLFEYGRGNGLGASFFGTYGAFYAGIGAIAWLFMRGVMPGAGLLTELAWIMLAYAVVTVAFLGASFWQHRAMSAMFLTLEVAEILLIIGFFRGEVPGGILVSIAGGFGILTAVLAWYACAAALVNGAAGRVYLPAGRRIVETRRATSWRRAA